MFFSDGRRVGMEEGLKQDASSISIRPLTLEPRPFGTRQLRLLKLQPLDPLEHPIPDGPWLWEVRDHPALDYKRYE